MSELPAWRERWRSHRQRRTRESKNCEGSRSGRVFGLGIGAIVRHTAGGIVALVGIMFVLPPILGLLPSSWSDAINPYLPSSAAGVLWTITPEGHTLSPWAGFALFCGYAAASLAIAAVLLRRRDT